MASKRTYPWSGALLLAALLLGGCGGGGQAAGGPAGLVPGPASGGAAPLRAAADADRDGVPDSVELQLGTAPDSIDSDGDGLSDHYELWGALKLPLGQVGSLSGLPDPNGNGIIAPLDQGDMGTQVLKQASAVLNQERVPVDLPEGSALPNDVDGDGIPNDYELNGFYFQVDEDNLPWFYKWDGLDTTKKYFKTDPTQWSSDGDPFSDWEEATKINLDQRVKSPGDHPCIPAYPEIICVLTGYRIDLIEGVEVQSASGGKSERSWENSTETVANGVNTYSESGTEGEFKIGAGLKKETSLDTVVGGVGKATPSFAAVIKTEVSGYSTSVNKTSTVNSSVATNDHSGLTAAEWSTATTTTTNTASAARLTLNLKVVNVGTLPASNPIILCNLMMGDLAFNSIVINMTEYGELQPKAGNPLDVVVQFDGRIIDGKPQGDPIELSLYQLRSLQSGVPLELEVKGWEGDTLVWEIDPGTGRRSFLTTGSWSPYQAAIQNVTARLVLDLRQDPAFLPAMISGLPPLTVGDTRVFCYNPNGTYVGSPPDIRLGDAFLWAFEGVESDIGPVVTIRDPISKSKHTSPLALWEFSFDKLTIDRILSNPAKYGNVFNLPLEPGNPSERVYTAAAPPPAALANPRIYWATCDPLTRRIRAISRDVRGIKEMRFKPDPAADYPGEKMKVGFDPADAHQQFFYTYELPAGYKWTGNERVVATNRADKQTELKVEIEGGQLGYLLEQNADGTNWPLPLPGNPFSQGYSFASGALDLSVPAAADFVMEQSRGAAGELNYSFTPRVAQLHDALVVLDVLDANNVPIPTIDYNYLRKQAYGDATLAFGPVAPTTAIDPLTLQPVAPLAHSIGVRSSNGVLAVFTPVLVTTDGAAPFRWQVGQLKWRTYTGI